MTAAVNSNSSVLAVLDDLTRAHNGASNEKTASTEEPTVVPAEKVAQSREELSQVLAQIGNFPAEKTATEQTPVDQISATNEIHKLASQLEQAEVMATIKEGNLFGAAAFDGWIQRANQFLPEQAASEKQASDEAALHGQLQKIAAAGANDIDQILTHHADAAATQQKEAQVGVDEAITKVAEVCVDCFNSGFTQIQEIVAAQ